MPPTGIVVGPPVSLYPVGQESEAEQGSAASGWHVCGLVDVLRLQLLPLRAAIARRTSPGNHPSPLAMLRIANTCSLTCSTCSSAPQAQLVAVGLRHDHPQHDHSIMQVMSPRSFTGLAIRQLLPNPSKIRCAVCRYFRGARRSASRTVSTESPAVSIFLRGRSGAGRRRLLG